jgi:spermidine synthase
VAFVVTASGLIEMAVEFVVLLGFQVAYGYVYHYVGILVASFMVGLTAGAWVSSRWVRRGRATWGRLVAVQGGMCLYPLCLLGFLTVATRTALASAPLFAALSFSAVAFVAGLVGGLQFPVAASQHSAGERAAGTLYGLDLFGACLGALAVSSILVPTFGLGNVCLMLSGLAGLGLVGLGLFAIRR